MCLPVGTDKGSERELAPCGRRARRTARAHNSNRPLPSRSPSRHSRATLPWRKPHSCQPGQARPRDMGRPVQHSRHICPSQYRPPDAYAAPAPMPPSVRKSPRPAAPAPMPPSVRKSPRPAWHPSALVRTAPAPHPAAPRRIPPHATPMPPLATPGSGGQRWQSTISVESRVGHGCSGCRFCSRLS